VIEPFVYSGLSLFSILVQVFADAGKIFDVCSKNLLSQTNDLISSFIAGTFAVLTALSLSMLSLIMLGISLKPTYFCVSKETFAQVDFHVVFRQPVHRQM
jgi:hypothetical protein